MIKPNNRASPEGNHTTALTGEEMQSPFGGWRHHLSPQAGALWVLRNGAMSLQESIETYSAP